MRDKGNPRLLFYLDSNVVLGQLETGRRSLASKLFFEEFNRRRNWALVVSSFGWAEVIDTLNESAFIVRQATSGLNAREVLRQTHLRETHLPEREKSRERLFEFQRRWKKRIALIECEGEAWEVAFRIVCSTDIAAPDAIHVAAALKSGCDVFLTEDEPLFARLAKLVPQGLSFTPLHCADKNNTREFLESLDHIEETKSKGAATIRAGAQRSAKPTAAPTAGAFAGHFGIDLSGAARATHLSPLVEGIIERSISRTLGNENPTQAGALMRRRPRTRSKHPRDGAEE